MGAPKAGTTSLHRYLALHPQVHMSPIKEPCFFAPEVVDFTPHARAVYERDRRALRSYLDGPLDRERTGIVLEWEQYLKLFKNARDAVAIGEVSGNYFASPNAPRGIRERIPDARIVIVLRNPVDRLFAQYVAARSLDLTRLGFADWAQGLEAVEATRQPRFGDLWIGRYPTHLKSWWNVFPREQVRVYFYDDYRRDTAAILREILSFLGVDALHPIDVGVRHNVTRAARWPRIHRTVIQPAKHLLRPLPEHLREKLRDWYRVRPEPASPAERARVLDLYRNDIVETARLTGRDLSGWLRG